MKPGMTAATRADRVDEVEKMKLKKLKADTYKVRRAEGRPKHGKMSMVVCGLGFVSLLMQSAIVFMPAMRENKYGVFGYAQKRGWGFFQISGKRRQFWHDMSMDTCNWWGGLNVGGMCGSPICIWYRLKCETYTEFMVLSYILGSVMVIAYLLHIACVAWTAVLNTRMIRYAGKTWPIIFFVDLTCSAIWIILSENMFDTLNDKSHYPTPELAYGTILSGVSGLLLLVCAIGGCQLWSWWPDIDLAAFDSSDEDEEDKNSDGSDTDDDKTGKKDRKPKAQSGGGANGAWEQQSGTEPGMGMGMAIVQQGYYDPSQSGMQYVQPQEGNGSDMLPGVSAEGAGVMYTPGHAAEWESQPAELRKGDTYMPQHPPGAEGPEASGDAFAEGMPQQPGSYNKW